MFNLRRKRTSPKDDLVKKMIASDFNTFIAKSDVPDDQKNQYKLLQNLRRFLSETLGVIKTTESVSLTLDTKIKDITGITSNINSAVSQLVDGNANVTDQIQRISNQISDNNNQIQDIETATDMIKDKTSSTISLLKTGEDQMALQEKISAKTNTSFQYISKQVSDLNKAASEIMSVVDIINGITDQTNLLALNASIEAARAGDAGRGFAVVADEIRKLSINSQNSTESIHLLIKDIQVRISDITKNVNENNSMIMEQQTSIVETKDALSNIHTSINGITDSVKNTSALAANLSLSSSEISAAIQNISAVTEETYAMSQEVSANTAQQLSSVGTITDSTYLLLNKIENILVNLNQFEFIKLATTQSPEHVFQFELLKHLSERDLSITLEPIEVPNTHLFKSIADNTVQGTLAPWMPSMEGFYQQHSNEVETLGINTPECIMGLAVPSYSPINKISDIGDYLSDFNGIIYSCRRTTYIGSIMPNLLRDYGLDNIQVEYLDEEAIFSKVTSLYKSKKQFIFTGWKPHYIFGEFQLKILEDNKKLFGIEESMTTFVNKGLKHSQPELYQLMSNLKINALGLNKALYEVKQGKPYDVIVKEYVNDYKL